MFRFPLIFLLAFAVYASAQPQLRDKEKVITNLETFVLRKYHYQPPDPDDAFSRKVFDLFLKRLDPQKRFFLKRDVDSLSRCRDSLDDQLQLDRYDFCEVADALLALRIGEARATAREILKGDLGFDEDDSLFLDPEKQEYAKSPEELRERWTRLLKFQALNRIEGKLREAAGKDTTAGKKTKPLPPPDTSIIHEAIAFTARNLDRSFARMIREEKLDRVALYLNTVANVYDPHTEYFKPQAHDEFDLSLTGKLEGIGAVLKEDDGYIKVVSIVPGSASWRQKELKAEDKILKVAQGADEPVDIVDASVEEAVKLIRGKKGTEVRLTVQEPGGQTKVIPIVRDVVIVDESYAKSAVLEPLNSKRKIGYIFLPVFYHDFNHSTGRNSAEDVRRELEKLKAKNVDGIILDLRNDGGGSLDDAIDMAGLFIDYGPVVQVKSRSGRIEVREDNDPAVVYGGPLVVMVNTFSASASEILAAAMQDYNRAIIVGTDTTWGKGTVQMVQDLDNTAGNVAADLKPLGAVKPTMQKFYRVSGGSTQLRGVAPDILLPDSYTELDMGERSMDYPMPWDTIAALDIHKWKNLPPADFKSRSSKRIAASPYFQQVGEFLKRREIDRKRKYTSLKMTSYMEERERNRHESAALDSLQKKNTDMKVDPLPMIDAIKAADSLEQEKVKSWKESLGKDFYLREAVDIVGDWAGKK